jgi:hypothetical protein
MSHHSGDTCVRVRVRVRVHVHVREMARARARVGSDLGLSVLLAPHREDARAGKDAPYPLPREKGAHRPNLQLHAGD